MDSRHVKNQLSERELALYKQLFNEAAYMGGTPIKYCGVKTKTLTYISDEQYEWDEPIEIDCIYDERPKVQLLKRLNWYTEDTSIQPRILYIPMVVNGNNIEVRRGALIKVKNAMNPLEDDVFQVSEVRTDMLPLYYLCNLVPFRKQDKPTKEPGDNNKWLDV